MRNISTSYNKTDKLYWKKGLSVICSFLLIVLSCNAQSSELWLQFEGKEGPGQGKHIVLISGDDEYRSEEGLPMLAKILSKHHGFNTTVLFAIDPSTNTITPNYPHNIPGMGQLKTADLVIMLVRFRELPDEQMKHFDEYLKSGKPIIGLRTSTHAFNYSKNPNSPFAKYTWQSKVKGWELGFGAKVLGETWVAHHGHHGHEGTRALIDGLNESNDHPILRGVKDIWGPSDVYTVKNLPKEANVLLHGQSTRGMTPDAEPMWDKSVMPIAWTLEYKGEGGKTTRVFTTTMGASTDLVSADLRRLIVNASFWLLDMESAITPDLQVDYVGDYKPTDFGFDAFQKGLRPTDYR